MVMGRRGHASLLAILAGLLVLPAGAIAKEVSAARICGVKDCVDVGDEARAQCRLVAVDR